MISVLTPSILERADYRAECKISVEAQTFRNFEHLVEVDRDRDGCSVVMNRLAARAEGSWLLPLADDDLLLPGALASLVAAGNDADVVYSPPLVWGIADPWWFFQAPPAIPAVALIRKSLWDEIGGYDETVIREEDRVMWTKALELGAKFVRVSDAPTWVYRIHGGNKSFNDGISS